LLCRFQRVVRLGTNVAALIEPATGLRVALAERLAQATQADST